MRKRECKIDRAKEIEKEKERERERETVKEKEMSEREGGMERN